jgi:hypothetical protein
MPTTLSTTSHTNNRERRLSPAFTHTQPSPSAASLQPPRQRGTRHFAPSRPNKQKPCPRCTRAARVRPRCARATVGSERAQRHGRFGANSARGRARAGGQGRGATHTQQHSSPLPRRRASRADRSARAGAPLGPAAAGIAPRRQKSKSRWALPCRGDAMGARVRLPHRRCRRHSLVRPHPSAADGSRLSSSTPPKQSPQSPARSRSPAAASSRSRPSPRPPPAPPRARER